MIAETKYIDSVKSSNVIAWYRATQAEAVARTLIPTNNAFFALNDDEFDDDLFR